MIRPRLDSIDQNETLAGTDEVSRIIADSVVEELGKGPESSSVTHHDVRRAAEYGARLALEFYDNNPPINRGEQ